MPFVRDCTAYDSAVVPKTLDLPSRGIPEGKVCGDQHFVPHPLSTCTELWELPTGGSTALC